MKRSVNNTPLFPLLPRGDDQKRWCAITKVVPFGKGHGLWQRQSPVWRRLEAKGGNDFKFFSIPEYNQIFDLITNSRILPKESFRTLRDKGKEQLESFLEYFVAWMEDHKQYSFNLSTFCLINPEGISTLTSKLKFSLLVDLMSFLS